MRHLFYILTLLLFTAQLFTQEGGGSVGSSEEGQNVERERRGEVT
jgi:hypothetical protein